MGKFPAAGEVHGFGLVDDVGRMVVQALPEAGPEPFVGLAVEEVLQVQEVLAVVAGAQDLLRLEFDLDSVAVVLLHVFFRPAVDEALVPELEDVRGAEPQALLYRRVEW